MRTVPSEREDNALEAPLPTRISSAALEHTLRRLAGPDASLTSVRLLAADRAEMELKQIGYGEPMLVTYRVGTEERRLVFRTMAPNWFGHDRRADRAALALLAADTYADVPKHVRVADVGAIGPRGELLSLEGAGEFYLVTTYEEGRLYADDLRALESRGGASALDLARARALGEFIAEIHAAAPSAAAPEVYVRAIRDLIGSGEGVFGIADSYAENGPVARERIEAIEQRCLAWRHRLLRRTHRLRRTHGDFHPYNVLFRDDVDFTILDASRGGAGDPADDVAAMTINYFFGGVVAPETWPSGSKLLWETFWKTYIDATGDDELFEVIAPFFAWRALVVASPVWYPTLSIAARDRILGFAEAALAARSFDTALASRYAG